MSSDKNPPLISKLHPTTFNFNVYFKFYALLFFEKMVKNIAVFGK
jgi:hypothetical protein